MSACLAARTNALGTTVRISLRNSSYPALSVSGPERANFTTHEGAFWGNVFGSSPLLYACKDEGGGPAGRLCTDGSCGFAPTPLPSCSDSAGGGCDGQDADKNWSGCGSSHETIVLNTFLMTENVVSAGRYQTCVAKADNSVWCWGKGSSGMLGNGSTEDRTTPTAVVGLPVPTSAADVPKELALGLNNSCVRLRGGNLWCTGDNAYGQIGDGSNTLRSRPVQYGSAQLGSQAIQVAPGGFHTCALRMDGSLWCAGDNAEGQLGRGSTSNYETTPAQAGLTQLGNHVVQAAAGYMHSCALKDDGTLWCWGYNLNGQLGDGTTTSRSGPVQAGATELGNQVLMVKTAYATTCAMKTDRTIWCWGNNMFGQVADGSYTNRSTPAKVSLAGPARDLHVGTYNVFVTLSDGSVWGWGYNYEGQLGDGTVNNTKLSPVRLTAFVTAGDGKCETTESTIYEAADCGSQVCGDGFCAGGETCSTCAVDCPIPTFYRDADGDGFGTPSVTTSVCGTVAGYVTNSSDCNDANAAIKPSATETKDGIDNDCDGVIDEGFNLLANPSFTTNLANWTASTGTLTRATKNCRSTGGCASLATSSSASLNETVGATGAGTYAASAWVRKGSSGTIVTYIQIEERTSAGALVGTTNGTSSSAGTTYLQLSASRAVTSPTNKVLIKVFKTSGTPMLMDDVSLVRQ